jgi:signal transduction histidine kinase
MELARQAGESILNNRATAEIARRLVMLQRQRIAESQVIDQRARRLLHDEILPALHTTLLNLSTNNHDRSEAIQSLSDAHGKISRLLRELPTQVAPELLHLGLTGALQQLAETDLRNSFDEIHVHIDRTVEEPIRHLPQHVAEVIYYAAREAIRNAARHGRGPGKGAAAPEKFLPLNLELSICWSCASGQPGLELKIIDTGVGFEGRHPDTGLTGGSGQGLALHSTLLAVIGGSLVLSSEPGQPTSVTIFFPETGIPGWNPS